MWRAQGRMVLGLLPFIIVATFQEKAGMVMKSDPCAISGRPFRALRLFLLAGLFAPALARAAPPSTSIQSYVDIGSEDGSFVEQSLTKTGNGSANLQSSLAVYGNVAQSSVSVLQVTKLESFSSSLGSSETDATSEVSYGFEVVGPTLGLGIVDVPVDYVASLYSYSSPTTNNGQDFQPGGAAFSVLSIINNTATTYTTDSCTGECEPAPNNLVITSLTDVVSGGLVTVEEGTEAASDFGGSASAYADPYFFIDPTFAKANPGYSLVFSENVGNFAISAAPEPSIWVLMIAGVGLAGGMLRRRGRFGDLSRLAAARA